MDEDEFNASSASQGVNFIPCVKFVSRGKAKANPDKIKLTADELADVIRHTKARLKDEDNEEDEKSDLDEDAKDDFEKEYDLANYEDEDEKAAESGQLDLGDLVAFADPKQDPYLKSNDEDEEDKSDAEDVEIRPTDNLVLVGHVEGDASILEVYVYNDVEGAFYVHHDLLLPSFPLALEWIGEEDEKAANLVAVGSMLPDIDVWDLDVIDGLEPAFTLKGHKKGVKGHSDAVLALASNRNAQHVLASGSVDRNVLLWDVNAGKVASRHPHGEKVQALQWHPFEAETLLTGCCDEIVRVFDAKSSSSSSRQWKVNGPVEKVLWNHFAPFACFVATESGHVHAIDVRQEKSPLWTLKAHDDCVNGLNLSAQCPDCLVTVSSDETLKVWDVSENRPKCVEERRMALGRLHALDACPDAPFVIVIGGDKAQDNLKLMDVREMAAVKRNFADKTLRNPLNGADFGFGTLGEAEKRIEDAMKSMEIDVEEDKKAPSGGATKKALKKRQKKQKKKKPF